MFAGPICSCQWIKLLVAEGYEGGFLPLVTTETFHLRELSLDWADNCLSDAAKNLRSQWPEEASRVWMGFVWAVYFSLKAETRKDVQWCSTEGRIAEKTLRLDAGTEGDLLSSALPDRIYFYIEMSPDKSQEREYPSSLDAARGRELKTWGKRRSSWGDLNAQLYIKIVVGRERSLRKLTTDAIITA